ncbi:EamA family transporter RarD [Desulfosarcina sp. OttesenSCG-928-A07]|nr:EamA family transporter RarD [Desulfosarcina sp. OttesenSCG-928-G17]MDL2328649.1 EamA family transporter RarD [Desulfosarcina sp. OttesenSCG-928-A07]
MKQGMLAGFSAYVVWGLLPLYWKLFEPIPAVLVLCHRILWSFIFLFILLALMGQVRPFPKLSPKGWGIYILSSLIIGLNWFLYIWSVNAGLIVETSLGYFINPLFSVLLGLFFLGERLRKVQWIALGLACSGVIYMTIRCGRLPWVALVLASTFALYGFAKKKAPLSATSGLVLETAFLLPLALGLITWNEISGPHTLLESNVKTLLLLASAGVVTSIPLILFSSAAHRIPLYMIGFLQYISPTIQFLLGVFVYHETFGKDQLVGFCLVWASVIIFCLEGLFTLKKRRNNAVMHQQDVKKAA